MVLRVDCHEATSVATHPRSSSSASRARCKSPASPRPQSIYATRRDQSQPKVVAAEAGMLAFVTPDQPLSPSTLYTLSITGARDTNDFPLPQADISFTTADAAASQTAPPKAQPQSKDDPPPPPLKARTGITALYGHSRTSLGKYLPGITMNLDCGGKTATATTDSLGVRDT